MCKFTRGCNGAGGRVFRGGVLWKKGGEEEEEEEGWERENITVLGS